MMTEKIYGFEDKDIAQGAKRLVLEDLTSPNQIRGHQSPRVNDAVSRSFCVVPKADIPARIADDEPSVGDCYFIELNRATGKFQFAELPDGTKREIQVYNDTAAPIPAPATPTVSDAVKTWEDQLGNLFFNVPTRKLIGVTNSAVSFGGSVEVTIYASTSPGQAPAPVTPLRIETAWFDWLVDDSPEDIEGNTDVAIEPAEHGGYRIYHAACSARTNR